MDESSYIGKHIQKFEVSSLIIDGFIWTFKSENGSGTIATQNIIVEFACRKTDGILIFTKDDSWVCGNDALVEKICVFVSGWVLNKEGFALEIVVVNIICIEGVDVCILTKNFDSSASTRAGWGAY